MEFILINRLFENFCEFTSYGKLVNAMVNYSMQRGGGGHIKVH